MIKQVGLEIPRQDALFPAGGLVAQEIADEVEDGAIQDEESRLDGFVADGLRQV